MKDEIQELINTKKKLQVHTYMKWLNTKSIENKEAYNKAKKETSNKINNHQKNEMWDIKCEEIDRYIGGRRCGL